MYEFTFFVAGPDELISLDSEEHVERIYEAINHDGLLGRSNGRTYVNFSRAGSSFETAVLEATLELMKIPELELVGFEATPDAGTAKSFQVIIDEARKNIIARTSALNAG